jgi:transposase
MECTGPYHRPVVEVLRRAGIFVSAVNPHLIKNFGNNTIRKVKTDPADAKKIARYTLDVVRRIICGSEIILFAGI